MDGNKVKEIMSDEAFVKQLLAMETPAEAQAAFKEKGLDFTEEQLIQVAEQVNKYVESGVSPEELSLEQLEEVSGGIPILIGIAIVAFALSSVVVPLGLDYLLSKFRW